MRWAIGILALGLVAAPGARGDEAPGEAASVAVKKAAVVDYLTPKLPSGWSVHVSQADDTLVAYLMMPINRAFELAYRPEETSNILLGLCPPPDQSVWRDIGSSTRLELEPVAMGKGFVRMPCVRAAHQAKAQD